MGLGALCDYFLALNPENNIYFWIIVAAGIGIGLLTAFVIEYKLMKKERTEQQENNPQ